MIPSTRPQGGKYRLTTPTTLATTAYRYLFSPQAAYQNHLDQATGEGGKLKFAGKIRTVNSVVLLSNGISFASWKLPDAFSHLLCGNSEVLPLVKSWIADIILI